MSILTKIEVQYGMHGSTHVLDYDLQRLVERSAGIISEFCVE